MSDVTTFIIQVRADFRMETISSNDVAPKAVGASVTTSTNYNSALMGLHVRLFLHLTLAMSNHLSDFFGRPGFANGLNPFLLCHIWAIPFQGSR